MTLRLPAQVDIIEVGLRDGLQNEAIIIPTATKIALIHRLIAAGVRHIQVASFVNPRRVPQMADAESLCAELPRSPGVIYSGLALNVRGVERAGAAGLMQVDIGISASDTHSRKNAGLSLTEALEQVAAMVTAARAHGLAVRAGVQCAFGCVYEGNIPLDRVVRMVDYVLSLGVDELALADSTGMANPRQVAHMLDTVLPRVHVPVTLHLHDTRGMGLANVLMALQYGVTRFDTAFGGLGGCPFIAGAAGNIATEDTVYMLEQVGIATAIDWRKAAECSRIISACLARDLPGKLYRLQ
ncbi:hydroxymethylglutaryl-CoA lyase [Roseiflexus castenholzii]|uniref:Pyruvate carboxyltransferase n=1 Tax=Roseiflexus castenholzii (strain DSM 13941 / HLO8) TaxID=383372 RepID=A7NPR9_ROSCS|nr:hydroxymethylglutaryl-CoA lyase [Roseiflexus castenholzii]ABU59565.1 pyruvate carboxyltransferase [Roseiflexus castenholzii DSM 13941]